VPKKAANSLKKPPHFMPLFLFRSAKHTWPARQNGRRQMLYFTLI
jgi:hypothetical protein